jgi:transposase InsO family protein
MLKTHGMVSSMNRKGNCWDNAVAESFFGSLKTDIGQYLRIHRGFCCVDNDDNRQVPPYKSRALLIIYNISRAHDLYGHVFILI